MLKLKALHLEPKPKPRLAPSLRPTGFTHSRTVIISFDEMLPTPPPTHTTEKNITKVLKSNKNSTFVNRIILIDTYCGFVVAATTTKTTAMTTMTTTTTVILFQTLRNCDLMFYLLTLLVSASLAFCGLQHETNAEKTQYI